MNDFETMPTGSQKALTEKDILIIQLCEALTAAKEHLEYCGYGDAWERECAEEQNLEKQIEDALKAGTS